MATLLQPQMLMGGFMYQGFKGMTIGARIVFLLLCLFGPSSAICMEKMSEADLASVQGKGLIISDKIPGADGSNHTFYRAGLDAKLELNANIDKFQLGCGGTNNSIKSGCDIDIDFLRLMGNNGNGQVGQPVSDFTLIRPYFSFAIKNDDDKTLREVVGIKLGAETADGFLGIGRRYSDTETNQERGGTCDGGNDVDCHSGLNRFSGNLNFSFSGTVSGAITCIINPFGDCGSYKGTFDDTGTVRGTRLEQTILSTTANTDANAIGIPLNDIDIEVVLEESLRYIHGLAVSETSDFSTSFQKESVQYPVFDYQAESGADKFAVAANTGWWMNFPGGVELTGLEGEQDLAFGDAVGGVLGATINLNNIDLNQTPPDNCYGSARFC